MINLAGTPTVGNPHSKKWARELRESRVTTTRVLAEAIAASDRRPAFLAQNAVGFYGDHGDEPVTEEADSRGDSLLAGVCRDWQTAADPAVDAGARVVRAPHRPRHGPAERAPQAAAAPLPARARRAARRRSVSGCR